MAYNALKCACFVGLVVLVYLIATKVPAGTISTPCKNVGIVVLLAATVLCFIFKDKIENFVSQGSSYLNAFDVKRLTKGTVPKEPNALGEKEECADDDDKCKSEVTDSKYVAINFNVPSPENDEDEDEEDEDTFDKLAPKGKSSEKAWKKKTILGNKGNDWGDAVVQPHLEGKNFTRHIMDRSTVLSQRRKNQTARQTINVPRADSKCFQWNFSTQVEDNDKRGLEIGGDCEIDIKTHKIKGMSCGASPMYVEVESKEQ